jgi:phenylacetate-coenzyme A ligase PaaK-like adenylate-forming protein
MSEVFGGASEDEASGWYYFDPTLVAEVVDPTSHEHVLEGRGILVLTSLFPLQEAQPLVRYYTGDIVAVTHTSSSRPGEIAIRPLGRERYAVPAKHGGWVLTPNEVYEAIDERTEIHRSPLFRDSAQVSDPHRVGHPRYSVSHTDRGGVREILIRIELRPEFLDAAPSIEAQLVEAVIKESQSLQRAEKSGESNLSVQACEKFPSDVISYRE